MPTVLAEPNNVFKSALPSRGRKTGPVRVFFIASALAMSVRVSRYFGILLSRGTHRIHPGRQRGRPRPATGSGVVGECFGEIASKLTIMPPHGKRDGGLDARAMADLKLRRWIAATKRAKNSRAATNKVPPLDNPPPQRATIKSETQSQEDL
jgi:hypothetical protein